MKIHNFNSAMVRKIVLLVALLFIGILSADSQCVMCRAVAEDASQQDGLVGAGINNAILYLMGIPYILLGILAFVFFKKKIGLKFDKFTK